MAGKGDGTYDPNGGVRRDQMASYLVRTYEFWSGAPMGGGSDAFSDDNGNMHEVAIDKAAAAGLTYGVGHGRYDPYSVVRRGQMASFLARMAQHAAVSELL